MTKNEKKFWDILTNLFVGAEVKGKSGFISLMRAKQHYFKKVQKELLADIKQVTGRNDDFKEELYDKLYSFFHRYFSESGSIYYNYTPLFYNVYTKAYEGKESNIEQTYATDYEQVISNKQDTSLFYKTQMLYYVKSDKIFKDLEISIEKNKYIFDVSSMQGKTANEKKELVYTLVELQANQYSFSVDYSVRGKKTKIDDMLKRAKKEKVSLTEEELKKAFSVFERQANIDYFINKDAKKFLSEQLDMWIYQYLFSQEADFDIKRFEQIKSIKSISLKLIDFIAQFENELVKIWNKPRFVTNSNIVVSMDKLVEKGYDTTKLTKHKNYKEQQAEWKELGIVEDEGLLDNPYLPIDTKYFKDLQEEIEELFEEDDFDGLLIKSENYQALNTILPRFKGQIDLIYIDPPYNAPASEIAYINNYKRSSWLSMMENRLHLAEMLLKRKGIFECAIDKNEQESLGLLLENIFPNKEKTCVPVIHNPAGTQGNNFSYTHEYTYFLYNDEKRIINLEDREDNPDIRPLRDVSTGSHLRGDAKNCFYPIYVKDGDIIGFGEVSDNNFHPDNINILRDDGILEIYPIDPNGNERKWVFARHTVESIKDELNVVFNKNRKCYDISRHKTKFNFKTVWTDKKYNANEHGSKLLNKLIPNNNFDFPKSLYNVRDCIELATNNNSLILDFFAGSGTTAHAIMDLNKSIKNSKRKFLLVEMGEHFNTVVLPRIKKIAYASEYEKGKAINNKGIGLCFKYYELEQYEQILRNLQYTDVPSQWLEKLKAEEISDCFLFDGKLSEALNTKTEAYTVDIAKIYENIDLKETIHNLTGKRPKEVTDTTVTYADGSTYPLMQIIKPLLVW